MTAIYAYSLPRQGRAALVSDDREIVRGSKINKVWLAYHRYAIAVYGLELTIQALATLGEFEGREGFPAPNNANTFANRLAETMKFLVEAIYPSYAEAFA